MDVISNMLSHMHVSGRATGLLTMQGDWAFESPESDEAVFHLISKGSLFVSFGEESVHLGKGDMILFTQGHKHVLGSAPSAPLVTFAEEDTRVRIHSVEDGEIFDAVKLGDGPETSIVCARFNLGQAASRHLSRSFPDRIIVHNANDKTTDLFDPLLRSIAEEAHSSSPGALVALDGMINVLFVHFMRRWLEYPTASHRGWLRGLQDPKIATALQLMHDMPAHEWSVQKLANAAGMSRSKFAARFADLIGEPPLKYLTSWRMVLAAQALESAPDRPLIDIAQSVGYQTEASFSVWFKRQFGKPPGAWRKDSSLQTSVRQKVS